MGHGLDGWARVHDAYHRAGDHVAGMCRVLVIELARHTLAHLEQAVGRADRLPNPESVLAWSDHDGLAHTW